VGILRVDLFFAAKTMYTCSQLTMTVTTKPILLRYLNFSRLFWRGVEIYEIGFTTNYITSSPLCVFKVCVDRWCSRGLTMGWQEKYIQAGSGTVSSSLRKGSHSFMIWTTWLRLELHFCSSRKKINSGKRYSHNTKKRL